MQHPVIEREKTMRLRRVLHTRMALANLRDLECELREQGHGSQDGYLLGVADRMREILKVFD